MSTANDHVDHLVDDYLHDLLPPDEGRRIEAHAADCPRCGRALTEARRRLGLLRSVPPTEPPAALVPDTMRRIEERSARWPRLRKRLTLAVVGALAASLVALVGAHVYYANVRPPTLDVVVLGQRDLLAATTASLRLQLFDRGNNSPLLAGVPIVVSLQAPDGKTHELARFTTDERGSGTPRFQLPDWPDGTYQLRIEAGQGRNPEVVRQMITLKRSWKVMLSSDKPVYKPGQEIKIRSLALRRPDLKPVANQPAVFSLTDPRGNVLFKENATTSAFGISSAACQLADEVPEGAYTLACKVGDTESKMTVEIRRYVLPKFEVLVDLNRPFYQPRETAKLTVKAKYFFGKPVAGAAVEVRVVATDVGDRVIDKLTGKTDAGGKLELDYTIPERLVGREPDAGDARLRFVATVTDTAEQKQSRGAERLVTTRPVRIDVIAEGGTLVRGVANTVWVMVSHADGRPAAGITVVVQGDGANEQVKADARGVASFTVTPNAEEVAWILRAEVDGAVRARKPVRLRCGTSIGDFLVRTDRAVYRAGQSMTVTALGGGGEPVFIDLVKDGQMLLGETVAMDAGKGEHTIDLPADLFGTVQLVAYRFTPVGLPLRKTRVLYIAPPEGLKIHTTFDRPVYRPGKQATLHVRLTDAQGNPTPGAVSLAAVDEAVFAVLAQRPGMEQTFYNLEQEMLKPVYAIYPWAPGERDAVQRDRALFAATAGEVATPPTKWAEQSFDLPAAGPHSLAARSLPAREQEAQRLQTNRLELVRWGWALLALSTVLAGYLALWAYLSVADVFKIHAGLAIAFVGFLCVGAFFLLALMGLAPKGADMKMARGAKMEDMAGPPKMAERALAGGMPAPKMADPGDAETKEAANGGAAPPRLRQHFPETLLWKPELITDDQGRLAPLTITLADSITTWRLSASAVSADGRLGGDQLPLRVFQPFFVDIDLPVSLTRNDEVGIPVVVHNHARNPQTVTLTLAEGGWFTSSWFTLTGPAVMKIDLKPGEVRSTRYHIKATDVGTHALRVTAIGGGVSDAIERQVDVVPDGRRVEVAHSGNLGQPAEHALDVPPDAIDGSVKAFVKLYPSSFSQVVEGLDGIFRMPYGCFEQTSSTTYPNVLALDYLKRNKLNVREVEAKARQYIHLGYQRLVGFEVPGGGFDWYGRPPANPMLTAYGLMQFEDMVKVGQAVDPDMLARTRNWLLARRKGDGSWEPDMRGMHFAGAGDQALARLSATAYIGWAVFADGKATYRARATLDYLLAQPPADIDDAHVLALVCHAVLAIDPQSKEVGPYLDRLAALAKKDAEGKLVWWERPAGRRTMFYGAGLSGQVETTALATLALTRARQQPGLQRGALAWLIAQKDPRGTWHSTQATVLALKALLAGSGPLGGDSERRIEVRLGDHAETVTIAADKADLMKQLDVSRHLQPGANRLRVTETSKTSAGYQVVFRYHVPEAKAADKKDPLAIDIAYDRTELGVNDVVRAKATVTNRTQAAAPMVMLDLPVPPGFAADTSALKVGGPVDRVQVRGRTILVYLRGVEPGKPLTLQYALRATMPVRVQADAARVYEYYDPTRQGSSRPTRFTVRAND